MDENKEFTWPEEHSGIFNTEPQPEEPAEEQPRTVPGESSEAAAAEAADAAGDISEEPAKEPAEEPTAVQEETGSMYRGRGAGRKESPFADSPYILRHNPVQEEKADYADFEPKRKKRGQKRKKSGFGRKLIAAVAALAVLAGGCGLTAHLVNRRWEQRFADLQRELSGQLQSVQLQVDQLKPQSTGISVSGTVGMNGSLTASQVYAQNVHSVVMIESTIVSSVYGQTATGVASGSGFIISGDGYVVTNFHVVEGASSVNVVLYDGRTFPAQLVGYDSTNDIALLKVEADGLDAVTLGSSDDLIVGDQVVAIGNPLGELTSTLTVGYVSAKERTVSTDGTVINMIQTDAAINSGNSGGPLFNMKGEVVGITTAKYSGASSSGATIEGIGFAIPMDDVLEELQELKDFGYIKSAYLGVMVQNMDTSVAAIYGLPVGAYVVGVEEGYCAQRAGIREKDIIVAVGEEEITSINDLTRALRQYEPGDKAKLTVYRAGQYQTILVVLDERPADVG